MNLLGFQTDIVWEDRKANFGRIEAMLESQETPGAPSLFVFPELSTCGFTMNAGAVAEPVAGESESFFSALAQRYQSSVIAGVARETGQPGQGANEAVCFAPDGHEIGRYRKRNPFPLANEADHYPAGDRSVVVQMGDWKVAPLICYDLRFPEPFREAVQLGAELFVVIASWPVARVDHWTTLLRARAIENLAYVVGVNRAGSDPHLAYPGASIVVGPKGEILAEAGDSPEILSATLDRAELLKWRADFPALKGLNP